MEDPWPSTKKEGWPGDESLERGMDGVIGGEVISTPMAVTAGSAPRTNSTVNLRSSLLHMVRLGLRERILHPNEIRRLINGELSQDGTATTTNELKASPGRFLGKIKSYSSTKGYGFMLCTTEGEFMSKDIYIHKNVFDEIWPVPSPSRPDDVYEFDIHKNKDGKPQASRPVRRDPPAGDSYYGAGYGAPGAGYGGPPGAYPPYCPPPRRGRRGGVRGVGW